MVTEVRQPSPTARSAGAAAAATDLSRARRPDATGTVASHGVEIAWETYGAGEPAILFVPTWSVVYSRMWKMQIADFARRQRVITFDPRGNGRSGRPADSPGYDERRYADDILAVMDATGAERAVLVCLSIGAQRSLLVAAEHPERVAGAVFIGPAVPLVARHPERAVMARFDEDLGIDEGWARYNEHSWRRDYPGFLEFFFSQCFSEPHSTKPIEDCVGWGMETSAEDLIRSHKSAGIGPRESVVEMAGRVRCPVLVIHGDGDRIMPHLAGAELARLTGGRLVTVRGGGHIPNARDPVLVNLALRDFVRSLPSPAAGGER